jgi:hypothetical protein
MSKGTKGRHIRISDELWQAAQMRAKQDGTDLSAVLREFLERYVAGK